MNDRTLHIILPPLPGDAGGNRPLYEFHISADCRARYAADEALFAFSGNVASTKTTGGSAVRRRAP